MKNIAELLQARVRQTPDKVGIHYQGQNYTWKEVYLQALSLSRRLEGAGIGRGDVVGVYADHSLAQVVAIFAISLRDSIFTLLNTQLAADQIKHQVEDAAVKSVIGTDVYLNSLADYFVSRGMHVECISSEGLPEEDWQDAQDDLESPTSSIPADIATYIYTSGSTGRPKGVVVPQRTLLDGARIVSGYLGITEDDNILSILPFGFDYGFNQLLSCIHTGAKITILKFIFPKDLVDTLVREKITGLAVVPFIWPKILQKKLLDSADLSHLRYVTTGGGFNSPELLRKIKGFLPDTEIIVMYGLTEAFRSAYLPYAEIENRPGSVGKAVPEVELLVLNEAGDVCAPGEKGELVHRGAFVTYGYLNNPELTEQKFIPFNRGAKSCLPEVAVRSGDLASKDADGFIYFHGRMDSQIKSSGYRISPDEVAQAVLATPGMSQAYVFGMSDDTLGEAVHLAYETTDKQPLEALDIKRHAKAHLASYALPQHFHFYEQIPLNSNAKPDLASLKANAVSSTNESGAPAKR